ncbi:hypothetical protein QMO56_24370 [Roseomonas sp. E05]|uniref:hypothetical protein n=1 Tax=Roseomonas sp. E05 TaxID=3046310 RepID=UPI0024B8E41F|nr:hypothetical protein [Roseomonas sp. E05]MDJ0391252.1 hypothetical protein [Roseomonas sp. E05]
MARMCRWRQCSAASPVTPGFRRLPAEAVAEAGINPLIIRAEGPGAVAVDGLAVPGRSGE